MKNYILIHSALCLLSVLVLLYLHHFVIRAQNGLAFIYLTIIAVFFISIFSGILGTKFSGSIWIPAAINCGVVLVAAILSLQAGLMTMIPPVFLVTFLCSFFTSLISSSPSGTRQHYLFIVLFFLLLMGGIYTFFAFINGPVHRGDSSLFFNSEESNEDYEPVTPTREQYENYRRFIESSEEFAELERRLESIYDCTLLADENGVPYSGSFYLYSPRLKINPLPRKKEVLLYYIDGLLWGYSWAQTHLPTYYTDKALLHLPGMPAAIPFLVHKKYEKEAVAALSTAGEYYVMPDGRLLALGEDNSLYIGEFNFHYNEILSYISWKQMSLEDGLDWYHFKSRYFDTLGFSDEDRTSWRAGDFIPADSLPDVILPGTMKDPDKIRFMEENFVHPVRIWLPGKDYQWNDRETLFSNLCGFHGLNKTKDSPVEIRIADRRDKSVRDMDVEDATLFAEILGGCFIETQLDHPKKKHLWYGDAGVYFVIHDAMSGKGFPLGYVNERFVMQNSLYTLAFPEHRQKELTEKMTLFLMKYLQSDGGNDSH